MAVSVVYCNVEMNSELNVSFTSNKSWDYSINTMSCPIKVNINTIELTVHTSCNCVLDLLCVNCIESVYFM